MNDEQFTTFTGAVKRKWGLKTDKDFEWKAVGAQLQAGLAKDDCDLTGGDGGGNREKWADLGYVVVAMLIGFGDGLNEDAMVRERDK